MFNVIIGNPPYQKEIIRENLEGRKNSSASAIYPYFIFKAEKIAKKITLIIPARFFYGGNNTKELKYNFENNNNLEKLIVYNKSKDIFPTVDVKGGILIFLINKEYNKEETNIINEGEEFSYNLNKYEVLIRREIEKNIFDKITGLDNNCSTVVSPTSFFSFTSNYTDYKEKPDSLYNLKIYGNKQNWKSTKGVGYVKLSEVNKNKSEIDKINLVVPRAYGSGVDSGLIIAKPFFVERGAVFGDTYISLFSSNNEEEINNALIFYKSKLVRFLISLKKKTQSNARGFFSFVPFLEFKEEWSDEKLYKKYNLTKEEIQYIEENIKEME